MVRAVGENSFQPKIGFKTRYGMVANPFAEGTTQGLGALTQNANRYYRRVKVTNLMWPKYFLCEGSAGGTERSPFFLNTNKTMKTFKDFLEQVAPGRTSLPLDLRTLKQKEDDVKRMSGQIKRQGIEKISPD